MIRKSASENAPFQLYQGNSSSSDTSTSSSSSVSDTPLRRFNRLLRSSVARHWSYFRKNRPDFTRGRSISDAGLCAIVDNGPDPEYLGIPEPKQRRSFHSMPAPIHASLTVPRLYLTSAGSGVAVVDELDADAERRTHLRVPTPCAGSTGNFASSGAGAGSAAPRSAPATPLQLEPHPVRTKHEKSDKHVVKPLSSSAPSVRVSALAGAAAEPSSDASDGKAPSKARQKKFLRHFPQVGPDERVLNYYSCALVGDILLQGHLYITKNYFAFYSNVFGYVTKLLIPTVSVVRVTKEKMARIIPNAVGVCTCDERHVFGSLLSRDSTHKLMTRVWKAATNGRAQPPQPPLDLRISEAELDASEYSPEDESSSGGGDAAEPRLLKRREPEAIVNGPGAAVIQPALLTGAAPASRAAGSGAGSGAGSWAGSGAGSGAGYGAGSGAGLSRALLLTAALLLAVSAGCMAYKLYHATYSTEPEDELDKLSGAELYSELVRWRARLRGRAASELQAFLSTNLLLLAKVRQSLEALSSVILTDLGAGAGVEPPRDAFS